MGDGEVAIDSFVALAYQEVCGEILAAREFPTELVIVTDFVM